MNHLEAMQQRINETMEDLAEGTPRLRLTVGGEVRAIQVGNPIEIPPERFTVPASLLDSGRRNAE